MKRSVHDQAPAVAGKDYGIGPSSVAATDASAEPWNELHDLVQGHLEYLEKDLRGRVPNIHAQAGRTKGAAFSLCTYRTFSRPDAAVDPVVASMTFVPTPAGVSLEADISGESLGDCIETLPGMTVTPTRAELLRAAGELAQRLKHAGATIAVALADSGRTVD